jgi:hypothetical protein
MSGIAGATEAASRQTMKAGARPDSALYDAKRVGRNPPREWRSHPTSVTSPS